MTQEEYNTVRLAALQCYLQGHIDHAHVAQSAHQAKQPPTPAAPAPPARITTAPAKPYSQMSRAELEQARPWLRPAKPSTKIDFANVR